MKTSSLPTIALAVLNSLIQLLGVLVWGWPIGNVFLLLWAENVIITLVAIGRIAMVKNAPDAKASTKISTSFGMLFFCFVHGVFSVALAFMTGLELSPFWFFYPLILLVVRYVVEAISWYARGDRPTTVAQAHGFAMRRIVMLHMAIIACWFVMVFGMASRGVSGTDIGVSLPHLALSVLLVIKTIAEVISIRLGPNVESSWKLQSS